MLIKSIIEKIEKQVADWEVFAIHIINQAGVTRILFKKFLHIQ